MKHSELRNERLVLTHRNPPRRESKAQWHLLVYICIGFLLLTVIAAVIYVYVSNEHTIYVSDYAGYQNITHSIVAQYQHSPLSAFIAIAQSMAGEYNALFTIPLIPWMLTLGESRITYEIALGVVYLLPFSLVLGALAVELVHARPRTVFWLTVVLALLTPAVWVPTLRGYPDTGAAVMLMIAIWIYLRDPRLEHPWHILLIGFLVTGSVLFRRHFAYAALAFFGAIALQVLIRFVLNVRSEPKLAWSQLRISILRVGLTAFVASLVLITLGRPFLIRFLAIDYDALYSGYTKPPLSSLEWFASAYGWLVVTAAVLGFLLGIRNHILNLDAAIFHVLFGSLTLLAWLILARQTGEQYTLNFTPTVVLGLSALLWNIILRFKPTARRLILSGGIAYLSVNLILALTAVPTPTPVGAASLLAMQEAPFTRSDQAQVMRLVDYFRNAARNGEPIYVAASSSIMGKDTLVSAERMIYGWDNTRLNILYSPEIDSRDSYPLELLLEAEYVLVVDPFQYHLSPERQRIVQVAYDIFKNNREFAQDFVEMPERFTLDEGAVAHIYRRVRPTSLSTAIKTFAFIRSYVQLRPGGQPDWISLDPTNISTVTLNRDHTYHVNMQFSTRGGMTTGKLLYIGSISDRAVLSGDIIFPGQRCNDVTVRVAQVTESGKVAVLAEEMQQPDESPAFTLTFEKHDPGFLLITVESASQQQSAEICPLTIDHLRIVPD